MTFAVGIPTIASAQTLMKTVEAVKSQDVETDIILVQNGSLVEEACDYWEANGVTVYRPYFNLGCSGSWNYACKWAWERGHDKIMLLNDDFEILDPGGLAKIESAIQENPNAHYHFQGFTSVCIRKALWDAVGEFDEGFYPAYFEDNDYYMRSIGLGIEWKIVEIDKNHYGSASLRTSAYLAMINNRTFPLNRARYVAKWGGMPHEETFTEAWNGGEPTVKPTREILLESGWEKFYD